MSKEKYLNDIKRLSSIKVKSICDELNINEKNVYRMLTSEKNIKLVRDKFIEDLKAVIEEIEG